MRLISIAGVAENRAIGKDGEVPWDIPEDKQFYRSLAEGHPLIIGRRTFSGVSVPNADYVVMSRSKRSYNNERVHAAQSGQEALTIAKELLADYDTNTVANLGGAEIYDLFMPYTDEMVISHIKGEYEANTFFPEWNLDDFRVTERDKRDEFEAVWYEQKNSRPLRDFKGGE